ncbi:MAG TPA: VWA domain-containing protein, partial [candidate division WOR-3 bacterium]|nr:VWA domain-containing protein [candidate division WOR-3 bacterium]
MSHVLLASIVVSACLLALAVGVHLRDIRRDPSPRTTSSLLVLLAMRLVSIVVLFAVLSGQVIRPSWLRPGRTVVVLVDVSHSMSFGGADSAVVRAVRALLPTLDAGVSLFLFAETTVVADEDLRLRPGTGPGRERTRMGAALAHVLRRQPGAVLLLSDGRDNGIKDPVQV